MQRSWDAVPSNRPSFSEIAAELENLLQVCSHLSPLSKVSQLKCAVQFVFLRKRYGNSYTLGLTIDSNHFAYLRKLQKQQMEPENFPHKTFTTGSFLSIRMRICFVCSFNLFLLFFSHIYIYIEVRLYNKEK